MIAVQPGLIVADLSGTSADRWSLVAAVLGAAAVGTILLRRSPKAAVVLWLVVVCFVPIWMSVKVIADIPPTAVVGAMILVALFPATLKRVTLVDWFVGFLVVLAVAAIAIGAGTPTTLFVAVMHWGLGYLVARVLSERVSLDFVYAAVAVVFTVVAVLAIAEFGLGWNPFVGLVRPGPLYSLWSVLQERGGVVRAEGAFGHSIALGASLALAVPLTLASPLPDRVRLAMVAVMAGGAVVTFSRIGIGCLVLGVALSVAFQPGRMTSRMRAVVIAGLSVMAVGAQAMVAGVFAAAGAEASNSAAYRFDIASLLSNVTLVGLSPSAHQDASGKYFFGSFNSVDSALLLLGLTYGALALALALVLGGAGIIAVLRRRASPGTIAMVAQLPALATVALITQYATFVWFVAGLAVAGQVAMVDRAESRHMAVEGADGHLHSVQHDGAAARSSPETVSSA